MKPSSQKTKALTVSDKHLEFNESVGISRVEISAPYSIESMVDLIRTNSILFGAYSICDAAIPGKHMEMPLTN